MCLLINTKPFYTYTKNNNQSKKHKIVKWKSWNEVCDRENKVVRIAEEMVITPKDLDGGYDARVLERMRTYDQNEPINLSNLLYFYLSFSRIIFRLSRSMSSGFDHKSAYAQVP